MNEFLLLKAALVKCMALNLIPLKRVVKKLSFYAARLLLCGSDISVHRVYVRGVLVLHQAAADVHLRPAVLT